MVDYIAILTFMFNPVEGGLLALASQLGKAAEHNIFYVVASFFFLCWFPVFCCYHPQKVAVHWELVCLKTQLFYSWAYAQGMFHLLKRHLFNYVYNNFTHNSQKQKIT